jgi:hypothetical protein
MTEEQALKLATHRHYKGGLYRWIADVQDTETGELRTWYEHIWPHAVQLWDRPATLFYGNVTGRFGIDDTPADIKIVRRFATLASGPTATSPEAAQTLASAVEAIKVKGLDTTPEIATLISAASLVSLHHKLCLDRNIQLEKLMNMICPECKGAGRVKVRVVDSDKDQGGIETVEYTAWQDCPACRGTGVLKGTELR